MQKAYPQAKTSDDYFKELTKAIETRQVVESAGPAAGRQQLLTDADAGLRIREAAARALLDAGPGELPA